MKKTIYHKAIFIASLIILFISKINGQVVNGNMNGTVGQGLAPTSWGISGHSPDLSCPTCLMFAFPGGFCTTAWLAPGPTASASGGNFANMGSNESIFQDLTGLNTNTTYKLSYWYTNMGYSCSGPGTTNALVSPRVEMTNQSGLVNSTALPTSLYTWKKYEHFVKFTAATSRLLIGGQDLMTPSFYSAYDDVSLTTTCQQNLPGFTTIGAGTSVTNASQFIATYGNNVNGGKYIVNGNFGINANLNLINCEIVCNSGAGIFVNPNVTLNIDRSFIHSCTNLWRGIVVQNNGNLTLTNNIIEDAHYAIEYEGNSTTTINGNSFFNNVIGIFYANTEVFSKNKPANSLKGNTFSGVPNQNLKPKYTGFTSNTIYNIQPNQPATITKPFAGIMTFDLLRLDIDNPITDPSNVFKNMTNGIIAYNVESCVANRCTFENITLVSGPNNLANGNGIYYRFKDYYSINRPVTLSINGRSKTAIPFDFTNCTRGIYAEGGGMYEIKNNRMTGMATGIELLNANFPSVDNNYVSAYAYCIRSTYNTTCPTVTITNNDCILNGNGSYSTAILVDNVFQECFHQLNTIASNCVTLKNISGFGIDVNNLKNQGRPTKITCNSIFLEVPTSNLGGVRTTNGHLNDVADNYIFSTGRLNQFNGDFPVAVHVNGSQLGRMGYNRFNDVYTGYKFTGPCSNGLGGASLSQSLIYGTRFQNLHTAFKFDLILTLNDIKYDYYTMSGSTPVLSNIYNMANEFNGTITRRAFSPAASGVPRIYWSGANKLNPCLSSSCNPSFIGVPATNPVWGASTTPTCGTTICNNIPIYPKIPTWLDGIKLVLVSGDNTVRKAILNKTLSFAAYQPEMVWQLEYSLYSELKPFESAFHDTTLEKQFIVEKDQENFLQFYEMQQDLSAYQNTADSSLEYYTTALIDLQHTIDSLSFIRDTTVDSLRTGVQQLINANMNSLQTIMTQYQGLEADQLALRQQYADSLARQNDSIIASSSADSLLLLYNSIYFDKYFVGDYQLTEGQKATMQFIANQCPFINYDIVSKARSAYRLYNASHYYDDSAICHQVGIINKIASSTNNSIQNELKVTIYPNPTKDMATLHLSAVPNVNARIFVTDIQGKVYLNEPMVENTKKHEFYTTKWAEGTYFIHLYEGKKLLSTQKLSIIH